MDGQDATVLEKDIVYAVFGPATLLLQWWKRAADTIFGAL